jgi:hypothetical protein
MKVSRDTPHSALPTMKIPLGSHLTHLSHTDAEKEG